MTNAKNPQKRFGKEHCCIEKKVKEKLSKAVLFKGTDRKKGWEANMKW